jgi:23S rRNA (cytidine1920-2'-O)/16S rRNA (cytidine1409-2'-O)-methyltransferase
VRELARERLDKLVAERGLAASREEARRLIMAGEVLVDGSSATKPGSRYPADVPIEVVRRTARYVSRGGQKLEKALEVFAVDVENRVAMDVGSSTGGFTDCLLQRGARHVYAVDVGRGQLAWSLRCDPRVTVMERTNFRYLQRTAIPDPLDVITVDVSFISLSKIAGKLREFSSPDTELIALVKPQFEAGPQRVGKKGVVKDPRTHVDTMTTVLCSLEEAGLVPVAVTHSPVTGPKGNIEFLAHLRPREAGCRPVEAAEIERCVAAAHSDLLAERREQE